MTTSDAKIDYENLDWETVDWDTFDWNAYDAYLNKIVSDAVTEAETTIANSLEGLD